MKKLVVLALMSLFVASPAFADIDLTDWRDGRGGHGRDDGRGGRGDGGWGRDDGRGGRGDGGWGRDDGRGGRGDGGWGRGSRCTVAFKSCRIEIGGFCVKWKSQTTYVQARNPQQACWVVERQYGDVKSCRATCGR